ncbi:MAG: hypothetical protein QM772_12295 [Ottowia sp.]|uniref:hypothetical protein n=1 Tax=Ottowia sp. TaxID=1898956 RepID=UPI0039E53B90
MNWTHGLRRLLAAIVLCCAGTAWAQITTTYDYASQVYGADAVAPYTAGMRTSGWVRVSVTGPLPASAGPIFLRDYVTDWHISDGVRTFTPANSAVMGHSHAYTDSGGSLHIHVLSLIQPGGPETIAHMVGDRVDSVYLWNSGQVTVRVNDRCEGVDPATNLCNSLAADAASTVFASHGDPIDPWTPRAAPTVAITAVPTLAEWAVMALGLLLCALGVRRLHAPG